MTHWPQVYFNTMEAKSNWRPRPQPTIFHLIAWRSVENTQHALRMARIPRMPVNFCIGYGLPILNVIVMEKSDYDCDYEKSIHLHRDNSQDLRFAALQQLGQRNERLP